MRIRVEFLRFNTRDVVFLQHGGRTAGGWAMKHCIVAVAANNDVAGPTTGIRRVFTPRQLDSLPA